MRGNDLLRKIGLNIRALRLAAGFSQENFAAHTGIDRSYMGSVERGERNIAAMNLIKIAEALACSPGDLFEGIFINHEDLK